MNLPAILNKEQLSTEEIFFLMNLSSNEELNLLFKKSLSIKHLYVGKTINKIASLQFSNFCENNCPYCNLREDSFSTPRFRLEPDEILEIINCIAGENITNIILQSGSDSYYSTDMISYLIYKVKKEHNLEITLDLSQRGFNEYRAWKFAGADNYLLKFNTANKKNYSLLTDGKDLSERINHIKYLKRIGYKLCTGNIIGSPNQTINDIVNDLILLQSIEPEMILNSPFIPQKFSKYQNWIKADFKIVEKITALSRILLKKSDILISDLSDLFPVSDKKKLFDAGANTIILEYYNVNRNSARTQASFPRVNNHSYFVKDIH